MNIEITTVNRNGGGLGDPIIPAPLLSWLRAPVLSTVERRSRASDTFMDPQGAGALKDQVGAP